jgi:hypothetical protein
MPDVVAVMLIWGPRLMLWEDEVIVEVIEDEVIVEVIEDEVRLGECV